MPLPPPTKKLDQLPPYLFAEIDKKIVAARAKGVDIINLGIGDPDLPTPAAVVEALREAALDPSTHNYPPYDGTVEYRQAAANWMKTRFGVDIDPGTEALSLIGSKEGIAHMVQAYTDPGDVMLCPSPGYPVYANYTILCGGEPYSLALKEENGFLPDLKSIPAEVAQKAKLLFLNYPNNPTGAIADEAFMKEAVDFCRDNNIILCHDNAYSEMTFGGYRAPSFLSVPGAKDVCVEFFSTSKMYNMTGWRAGFAVGNAEALKPLGKVKNNTDSGVFKAIQRAVIVALENSDALTKDLNAIYGRRREIMIEGLRDLGWTDFDPGPATFYLWLPVPSGMDSAAFAGIMLEKCGITVPPGVGYGPDGEGFFRIALTVPEERLREALQRMREAGVGFDLAEAA